jgi:hypothetical protein
MEYIYIHIFSGVVTVLGFEFSASYFAGKYFTTKATFSALFCFSYFSDRVSFFAKDNLAGSYASKIAWVTGTYHLALLVHQDRVSLTFGLDWPRTTILLISASQNPFQFTVWSVILA